MVSHPSPRIELLIEAGDWHTALPQAETLISAVACVVEAEGEISLLLTDDAAVQRLNAEFRGKDKPTNVLSFPSDMPGYLGDIAMALPVLQGEASEQGKPLEAHFQHLLLHGILHLLGYDHMQEKDAKLMEEKEILLLSQLGIANPYETR